MKKAMILIFLVSFLMPLSAHADGNWQSMLVSKKLIELIDEYQFMAFCDNLEELFNEDGNQKEMGLYDPFRHKDDVRWVNLDFYIYNPKDIGGGVEMMIYKLWYDDVASKVESLRMENLAEKDFDRIVVYVDSPKAEQDRYVRPFPNLPGQIEIFIDSHKLAGDYMQMRKQVIQSIYFYDELPEVN
jgi:hypothetical protein